MYFCPYPVIPSLQGKLQAPDHLDTCSDVVVVISADIHHIRLTEAIGSSAGDRKLVVIVCISLS